MCSDINADQRTLVVKQQLCPAPSLSSVLPTPVGPRKKLPRKHLNRQARARATGFAAGNYETASSWPTLAGGAGLPRFNELVHLAIILAQERRSTKKLLRQSSVVTSSLGFTVFLRRRAFCLIVFCRSKLWNGAVAKLGCLRQITLTGHTLHLLL